jgi:hypothetical protein
MFLLTIVLGNYSFAGSKLQNIVKANNLELTKYKAIAKKVYSQDKNKIMKMRAVATTLINSRKMIISINIWRCIMLHIISLVFH